MGYSTEQEEFWAGEFGDAYVQRNSLRNNIARQTVLFSHALKRTSGIETCLELGSNIGFNLIALGGGTAWRENAGG